MKASDLLNHLAHFTGSETFTRHSLIPRILMTEGVVFLAKEAGAHWLTDAIGSYLFHERARGEPFQVWKLVVNVTTQRGELTMTDGNSSAPLISQTLNYTDFPLAQIDLWLVADGERWVMMLPTEY